MLSVLCSHGWKELPTVTRSSPYSRLHRIPLRGFSDFIDSDNKYDSVGTVASDLGRGSLGKEELQLLKVTRHFNSNLSQLNPELHQVLSTETPGLILLIDKERSKFTKAGIIHYVSTKGQHVEDFSVIQLSAVKIGC